MEQEASTSGRIQATESWISPKFPIGFPNRDVHIWRANLNRLEGTAATLVQLLSAEERVRAASYYFEHLRNRFIVARGILRVLLGLYIETDPSRIRFCYNQYGKPLLEEELCKHMLQFSLSHSHDLALYAVTSCRKVGIDLEYVREIKGLERLASQILPEDKNARLNQLPQRKRLRGFLELWTKEEAVAKANGRGLLDQNIQERTHGPLRLSIFPLAPDPAYVAALAVEGHDFVVHQLDCEAHVLGFGGKLYPKTQTHPNPNTLSSPV